MKRINKLISRIFGGLVATTAPFITLTSCQNANAMVCLSPRVTKVLPGSLMHFTYRFQWKDESVLPDDAEDSEGKIIPHWMGADFGYTNPWSFYFGGNQYSLKYNQEEKFYYVDVAIGSPYFLIDLKGSVVFDIRLYYKIQGVEHFDTYSNFVIELDN